MSYNNRKIQRAKAEDIKHKGRLTETEIQNIPIEHVYTWVRTGDWKQKDFKSWLKAIRVIE